MHIMLDMHMYGMHKDRMTLSEYLTKKNETDAAFAARVSMSQSQISRLRRGRSKPSWEATSAISAATKGAVTANDWAKAGVAA